MSSKVIKGPEEAGSRLVSRSSAAPDESSVSSRADQMVADAEAKVAARQARAEEEALALLESSRKQGTEEGRRSADDVTELAAKLKDQLAAGLEREGLEAAVDATRELIQLEFRQRPRAIVDVVRKALGSAKHQRDIFVRANPKDAAVLRDAKRELLDVLSRARDIDIRDDVGMAQGGCVIETELGVVDAAVDAQIDRLARILVGRNS